METKYLKMSDLVNADFTVKRINNYKFVAWDAATNKYVTDDKWFKGAQKKYPVETNLGTVDMGANHIGSMFEITQMNGQANIIGVSYHLKSNGKTGIEIRYFVNPAKGQPAIDEQADNGPGMGFDTGEFMV